MDTIKITFAAIIGGILATLQPIHNAMIILICLFCIDIFIGIFTDLCVNKNRFHAKKFIRAFAYLAVYLSIIASIFVIGIMMNDKNEAFLIDKTITYIFVYFYLANIFANLIKIFPKNKPIALLEYILHLEFIKRFQWLSEFFNHEKEKKTNIKTDN
jgi:hypothetical protein